MAIFVFTIEFFPDVLLQPGILLLNLSVLVSDSAVFLVLEFNEAFLEFLLGFELPLYQLSV